MSCHSNQSSYPIGIKKCPYLCYMWKLVRIGFMASEEMSFENADEQRWTTDDEQQILDYTIT